MYFLLITSFRVKFNLVLSHNPTVTNARLVLSPSLSDTLSDTLSESHSVSISSRHLRPPTTVLLRSSQGGYACAKNWLLTHVMVWHPLRTVTANALSDEQRQSLALRAGAALVSKPKKTPLEDALASKGEAGYSRAVELTRWMRQQFEEYHGKLAEWRKNRDTYAAEAQDVFRHREIEHESQIDKTTQKSFFPVRNDSLNLVGSMCEFAAAQAEQDLFGGDPWFAAAPVGKADQALSDTIQKHLQWSLRDGRLVKSYSKAIPIAAALGEVFTKTTYSIETDTYEAPRAVLHKDGKPVMFEGKYVGTDDLVMDETSASMVRKDGKVMPLSGKLTWRDVYETKQTVIRQGVESCVLHHNDIAFREDAPELDLKHTNFYLLVEMSVLDAMQKFNLSPTDAARLAQSAAKTESEQWQIGKNDAIIDSARIAAGEEVQFGLGMDEQLLNSRIRLIEGYVRLDPFGDGIPRRLYVVFPPAHEDWLVFADYLGNVSPKAALPVHCHPWEVVPHRLYGKGFFAKYRDTQRGVDDTFSQVTFRNAMHSNPITSIRADRIESGEEEPNIELKPGLSIVPKGDWSLKQIIEFAELPDLDNRSMELLNLRVSMAQLRSGISSASQGDMSSLPENNTATGIRQLMSRAAVLLKKPIRGLRRSFNDEFSYTVTLFYVNFDRTEAFVWGEGENVEMLQLSAEQVRDLDIDVRMLLTQEQNQTKLEGAQVATGLFAQWIAIPEIEKANARPLYLQAMKALEFDQADTIIRQAAPTLADAITLLPQDQQAQELATYQAGLQVMAAQPPPQAAPFSPIQQPPLQQAA